MKRSRAFILSEQLMTIMLQAGFILVLCASFYQVISFYTRTQQVLTARNHAERVISFMDDKIRNAGLGLWGCQNPSDIRGKFNNIVMLSTRTDNPNQGYNLPVALQNGFRHKDNQGKEVSPGDAKTVNYIPLLSSAQDNGDVVTLLYAKRELASDAYEIISAFREAKTLDVIPFSGNDATGYTMSGTVILLDKSADNRKNLTHNSVPFKFGAGEGNIKGYTVMEGLGVPLYLSSSTLPANGDVIVKVFGVPRTTQITVPAAGELLALNCMQMFVHTHEGERQFAFRELVDGGTGWNNTTYNQEKGILDIYMELDTEKYTFTLWVLATGGYDASMNNPRPDTWPEKAEPTAEHWGKKVNDIRDYTDYPHHIVYVSRATWKLNNIPQGFTWN